MQRSKASSHGDCHLTSYCERDGPDLIGRAEESAEAIIVSRQYEGDNRVSRAGNVAERWRWWLNGLGLVRDGDSGGDDARDADSWLRLIDDHCSAL